MRRICFLLLILSCASPAVAIEAALTRTIFYLPDPIYKGNMNPYIEACWQVNPKSVRYNTNASKGIIARIQTDVVIINDTGRIIKEDHYIYQTLPCANADELAMLNILELKRYFLTPGVLKMKITLTDLNDTNNKKIFNDTIRVAGMPRTVVYSQPELIDTFYASDVKTPFRKHGQQFIPLCEPFYDNYRNNLSYYFEMYNGEHIDKVEFPLVQSVFISKKIGESPYGTFMKLDTLADTPRQWYSGSMNIRYLPSGNYYLNVSLGTKNHQTIARRSIFFQRMNTQPAEVKPEKKLEIDTSLENVTVLNLGKEFVAKYDMLQLRAILNMILPVADQAGTIAIEGFLKKPDELYMRYFIYNYFAGIDKAKPERAWKEFSNKIRDVNKKFNSRGKAGYETTRGFMYLRYGPPSEIVTMNNERGARPYEIWQYNTLTERGGAVITNAFILMYKQAESDADYRVLHTNISGELRNATWRNFLYNTMEGGVSFNSRAEQYIGNR